MLGMGKQVPLGELGAGSPLRRPLRLRSGSGFGRNDRVLVFAAMLWKTLSIGGG